MAHTIPGAAGDHEVEGTYNAWQEHRMIKYAIRTDALKTPEASHGGVVTH